MCGIAGVYTIDPSAAYEPVVARIVREQHSRGPDFNAVLTINGRTGTMVLGHNRLSIIDLSAAGNQPMWDAGRELCVVLNGEIYNYVELRQELTALGHRFLSTSDTEVILESFKRWGSAAIERFNGMFAFALYDSRDANLYLVRDRFGVKPLYYVWRKDSLCFASTAETMARALGLPPDLDYLSCGVHYGLWEHDEATPFVGMKALRPGHWLQLEERREQHLAVSIHQYYNFSERTTDLAPSLVGISAKDAAVQVDEVLDDAVRIRLRADVPVAISLSGGLDSSTIAALAARHHSGRLTGFTFGDPRHAGSEGPLVAQFNRMTGIDVTYVWPSTKTICKSYEETLEAQVGPYISGSIMAQYMVFQAARAAGFKVLLGGQGGDEAFMGYHKFQVFRLRHLLAQKNLVGASRFVLSLIPTVLAERTLWVDTWNHRHRYLRRQGLGTVLNLPPAEMAIGYSPSEPLRNRQVVDVALGSLPTLLRYEDSSSMRHSLESRLPFLDYRVMELGVALPDALKLRSGRGKWIVREAMAGRLPETIRNPRYKRGFDVQQDVWIDRGLGAHIRTLLRERRDRLDEYLPRGSSVDKLYSDEQLKQRPTAFLEATTLLWIANFRNEAPTVTISE